MTIEHPRKTALICGGGIAGSVTAMALERAGWQPILAEAFDRNAEGVGAFLTLAPNGVRGLRLLGIDEAALPGAFETSRFTMSLGDGRVLAELRFGAGTTFTIRRSELYSSLRRACEERGIRAEYGKRLVHAERSDRGVRARFGDGTEIGADVLIGADGIHSKTRSLLDPRAPALHYLGLLNTGGFARGVDIEGEPGVVHFVFGKRCFFGWVKNPNGEIWWFANPGQAKEPKEGELRAIGPQAWRTQLIDLFSVDATPAVSIIEATDRIIGPWPTHDLARVPTWHRDRMVLVGDAAHAASPSSGQGASMAIEDGIVLAKCLRDGPDIDGALAAYEHARRDRVERVVAQGRRNGSGKTPGPLGRVMRDFFLRRVLPRLVKSDSMAWIHDHRIDWQPT